MNTRILIKLIEQGYSQREIASLEKCSQTTIKYWLKKYNLKTKWTEEVAKCYCKTCGETNPNKFYRRRNKTISRKQCSACWNKRTIERNRKIKLLAIEYKGGKCQKCGYKKCPAGLAFHHRNPEEKDLKWNGLKSCNFDKLKPELDKCDMVCQNCHAEIHWLLSGNDFSL